MAVRRSSNQKTIHLVYNEEYNSEPDFVEHLPDLRLPMESLGFKVQEYFVSPANIEHQLADIPRDDPYHIVFMHVDMPQGVSIGTRLETARYCLSIFHSYAAIHPFISQPTQDISRVSSNISLDIGRISLSDVSGNRS